MTTLTAGGISAMLLVAAVTMMYKRVGKKVVPWLMLASTAVGLLGALGAWVDRGSAALTRATTTTSEKLFGVGVPLIIVVVMTIALLPHMRPKGQPPTKLTPWIAFLYPAVLVAAGLGALVTMASTAGAEVGTSAWATVMELVQSNGGR